MNNTQRAIATVGLIILIAVAVYPPWTLRMDGTTINSQYSFVWKAPQRGRIYYTMDRNRLTIPWLTVLIATIGFVKVFERKK